MKLCINLSIEGKWEEMFALVTDEMVETLVSVEQVEVANALKDNLGQYAVQLCGMRLSI